MFRTLFLFLFFNYCFSITYYISRAFLHPSLSATVDRQCCHDCGRSIAVEQRNVSVTGIRILMVFLGAFWYDSDSPQCVSAYWAIVHCRVKVSMRRRLPFISTVYLWLRILFTLHRSVSVSLPILFPASSDAARPLREGVSIARAADAVRDKSVTTHTLFPPRCIVEIDKFIRASDVLYKYSLQLFINAITEDPSAAEEIALPAYARGTWVANLLLRRIRKKILSRYPSLPSRTDVRAVLHALRTALSHGDRAYICSDRLTYADICMATSMFFAIARRKGCAAHKLYNDTELTSEFLDLIQWRRSLFEKHFPGSEKDAYEFRCRSATGTSTK